MKKVLLICMCIVSMSAAAQDMSYHSLLKEGKQWVYNLYDSNIVPKNRTVFVSIEGDTVINRQNCFKLYMNDDGNKEYLAAAYEEGKKAHYYAKNTTAKEILCDFSMENGDSIVNPTKTKMLSITPYYYTLNPDTVCFNGVYFPRQTLYVKLYYPSPTGSGEDGDANWYYQRTDAFVEGVGSSVPFINSLSEWQGGILRFEGCYEDGKLIFDMNSFSAPSAHSDDATSIRDRVTTQQSNSARIYNLQGQQLKEAPKKGLYIQNGRKYVVK